eukprot:GCRY01005701.1.p4 GENE.GCRY01005701.1~~GCRY01005701.1.p4  ORF type:complete len:104 (-),score=18.39 GCRY01005701.1:1176-1487(-)
MQKAALERLKRKPTEEEPAFTPSAKKHKAGLSEYLEMKTSMGTDKNRLEERRLELEERKLAHSIEMEKKRFDEEVKEKEHQRKIDEQRDQQFLLILQLLQKNN